MTSVVRAFDKEALSSARALVRAILEQPLGQPWKLHDIGLLGLWLDPQRRHRLHIWDPGSSAVDELIHDHPLDFTATVIAGQITNTRYEEDPAGQTYVRDRNVPGAEHDRSTDRVNLSGTSSTYGPGERYDQSALELHSSAQVPGTVTLLRFTFVEVPVVTTCRRPGTPWVSGSARPAEPDEIERFTALARPLLDA